ncbi:MAG: hypothetical protein DRO01_08115 [Thermoproteota archaeon]|nr:MAG: hypothetical protein DRO01_08115 [Candidatus Korarchaeota archaeon]
MDECGKLKAVLDDFSKAMYDKLMAKYRKEGYRGWDSPECEKFLIAGLIEHVSKSYSGNFSPDSLIDIANYCMFLWNLKKSHADVE